MADAPPWPVRVTARGACSVGTLRWRLGGRELVTVVVKAAFAIVPGGAMSPLPPPEIVREDAHFGAQLQNSIRFASDLVPYRPGVDVWLVGRAYPPGGVAAAASTARFA